MGTFWVFTNGGQGVSIYDPVMNTVVKTLMNVTLSPPAGYGDTVWMRDSTGTKNYVYISENTASNNRMHFYDATKQVYLGSVPSTANGRPVHTYAVPFRYEVWSHLDTASGFDVWNAPSIATETAVAYQVSPMNHNGVSSAHGKLLSEGALGNYGFQTNVFRGQLNLLDLEAKRSLAVQNISRSTDTYQVPMICCCIECILLKFNYNFLPSLSLLHKCTGTHGVGYNDPFKAVFVECSNPAACVSPYTSPTSCTGSLWMIDANVSVWKTNKQAPARVRLTSPSLVALYGAGFGIQGAPYDDPTFTVTLVTNPYLGWLHFVMPMSSPSANMADHMYVEFNMVQNLAAAGGINLMPSFVVWYPKDISVPFYTDSNPSNYYAVVGLNSADSKSGFAVIDMAAVMTAFESLTMKNLGTTLPASAVTLVSCGPAIGSGNRILERGGDYILTNVYSTTSSSYKTVCAYNMRTKTMVNTVNIPSANKAVYVGNGASLAGPTITLTASQPLTGVTAATFKASSAMQAAFINAVATAASIAPSAVVITGSKRRQLLQTTTTTVTYTVTTSNPSVTSASLTSTLTSSSTATALASALSSYGVTGASPATASATSPTSLPTTSPVKSSTSRTMSSSTFALFWCSFVLLAASELLHRKR